MGKKRNRTSQCGDEEKRVRRVESEGKTKLDKLNWSYNIWPKENKKPKPSFEEIVEIEEVEVDEVEEVDESGFSIITPVEVVVLVNVKSTVEFKTSLVFK